MDGNGRWAKERNLPRTEGHRQGIKRIDEILKYANESGIKFLTLFTFSTENWKRPKLEIDILMRSLDNFLSRNIKSMMKENIRFLVIGRKEPIPGYLWEKILKAQAQTKNNGGLTVILALNYGSRQEIVDAVKKTVREVLDRRINLEDLNEESFGNFLYTAGIPDPDLLIRTSGELRISNFLLWQLSYTELYFSKAYWPDFGSDNFKDSIADYQKRQRRFGAI